MMKLMYILRAGVLLTVSIVAAPFMVRGRHLILDLAIQTHSSVSYLLRFVAEPLPAVLALLMGAWGLIAWHKKLILDDHDAFRILCDREEDTPRPVRWALF